MFGKKKPQVAPDEDDAEARAKARRKKATRLPKGVKQLIGYDAMLRNGIASLGDGRWSATILFQDINYQLSPESHQMEIIDRWAKLINSFEAGQNVQIASYTRSRGVREILADVMMGETGDSLDHYRLDYNRLAQGKLESVSRNTSTVKTLTVTVRESDEQAAVATLNALCNNLVSQMRSIDACKATRLDREHRLRLMAEVLRPGEEFRFDERRFEHQPGKPDTKDLVCPWSIDARNPIQLDIESLDSKYLHRTMWVSSLPPELSDQLVNDLTGLRARVDVSIHLAPMDRGESMTLVRRKNAEVKMQIMDQRRKNRKQGLDPDDLPDDLADQQEQLGQLRDELRSTNQRLVDSIIVIGVSAASQEELEVACRNVKAKVNAQSCTAESLKFMQMEGLTAELPLGNNPLPMKRTLTTNSAAILIPFTTQEVFEPHGLFYGSNARSGNPILADRRSHMNSNGFVLGTSGGGKSFTVKQEIAGMFLNRDDEVIVIDPEREYLALAAAFGGQIIQISAGTGTRVNPMDIVLEDDSASDPVKDKTNNVVSMIGALIGGIDGLDPLQKGLVDQCVSNLYTRYRNQGGGSGPAHIAGPARRIAGGRRPGEPVPRRRAQPVHHRLHERLQRPDQRGPVQPVHRVRRVRPVRRAAHVRHDGRHRPGVEPRHPQQGQRAAHLAVRRRVPPLLLQPVRRRPVQGHLQARPQIRARRDRHHAERRGDPRPPGRARDAVQQRFPHAPEPEQHRRGRVVRAADPERGAAPVLHRRAARPGTHEDRQRLRAVRRAHPRGRRPLPAVLHDLPGRKVNA